VIAGLRDLAYFTPWAKPRREAASPMPERLGLDDAGRETVCPRILNPAARRPSGRGANDAGAPVAGRGYERR